MPTSSDRPRKKGRTGAEKLRAVSAAATLSEAELGAFLRREGLHEATLAQWRRTAEAALGTPARPAAQASGAAAQVKVLERELRRKDQALAETAALLVLKKKAHAIWGDADDVTPGRNGR